MCEKHMYDIGQERNLRLFPVKTKQTRNIYDLTIERADLLWLLLIKSEKHTGFVSLNIFFPVTSKKTDLKTPFRYIQGPIIGDS